MHAATESMNARKAATGIVGLDRMTGGGQPRGRAMLVEGGPGSGKTILALQSLVHGARHAGEPGIFVAFEESAERVAANAESFGWDLGELRRDSLFFLDARPDVNLIQSGAFDLGGLLAALEAKVTETGARRIVFDAIDVVLSLIGETAAQQREIYRLHEWLTARDITAIVTSKHLETIAGSDESQRFSFMHFMVDCSILLRHNVVQGISQRSLRVLKYRGSPFDENEAPFVIAREGLVVANIRSPGDQEPVASNERVSSGVSRLDTMLDGGYHRGASVLITGFPGTAKSTLAAAFTDAACKRGERTLFVSFDSSVSEVLRNMASVGIHLERHRRKGVLQMRSARAIAGSAETHLMSIQHAATQQGIRCLVVDPISALSKQGNEATAHSVAERLVDWAKATDITLVCTSLLETSSPLSEGTPLQISTIADTWIHLSYVIHAGERNRGLSIIKSRGASHSNQVRELILTNRGITLADTYTAGGEVLMGTLRWQRENAERDAQEEALMTERLRREQLEAEEAELTANLRTLQRRLAAKQAERQLADKRSSTRGRTLAKRQAQMDRLRGADHPAGESDETK